MQSAHAERVNKTFRLRLDWVRKAEKRAIDERRSLNTVIEEALERYAAGSGESGAARLFENARARMAARRRQFGGRFPEGGPLSRDQAYER